MAVSVKVGEVQFSSKKELTEYLRILIKSYSVGSRVSDEHRIFLLHLFNFHPDAIRKFNGGITDVEVRLDEYGKKHFQIFHHDGSSEEISWTKCVGNAKAIR
ncbi:DCL family protein [Acidovorax sp. NCPPB 3859]|nr:MULTISPECIES: DUF3223 domain-containing protein [unclassified Acidovorax]MDA8452869.1 DCL family protein [Acidovorax sp. GBBC 3297]MDA8462288.1 DCL family protein [Acidovorax sp. GBBC 3333]MDA8467311.1 DCL family protein [Acidovorax sp. GBBC 3332]MDA8472356.1 DCL family protein [Acidovorax sp. GBBC 3299]WCM78307.1 DCL family protein [Acidovorax sp. GBBC 712]